MLCFILIYWEGTLFVYILCKKNFIHMKFVFSNPTNNMCLNTSTTNNNREGRGLWKMFYAHYSSVVTVQDIHINNEQSSTNAR